MPSATPFWTKMALPHQRTCAIRVVLRAVTTMTMMAVTMPLGIGNSKVGRFHRAGSGVYRLTHYPDMPFSDLYVAWLRTGPPLLLWSEDNTPSTAAQRPWFCWTLQLFDAPFQESYYLLIEFTTMGDARIQGSW